MEEFLYCDTSSHWDAGRAVLNLVITPSDSVILTEHDVEKAEFVVVSAGAASPQGMASVPRISVKARAAVAEEKTEEG